MTKRDWFTWHDDYNHPGTALARRLAAVQEQIRAALDAAKPGPLEAGARMFTFRGHHPRTGLVRHLSLKDIYAERVVVHRCSPA